MKKKLILFLCAVFALALGFSSCGDSTPMPWSKEAIEEISTKSASAAFNTMANPEFTTVTDVVEYRDNLFEGKSVDSIFESMPEIVLKRVADVCINKSGVTDKKQIVKEYQKNRAVYGNMSEQIPTASTKDDKTATDSGGSDVTKEDGKVFETSYNYYTDTIDGKPVKVRVKTEKSYEK